MMVSQAHLKRLNAISDDVGRVAYVDEVLDPLYESSVGTDYDKAWSLLHSALQGSNPCADCLERMTPGPQSWAIMGTRTIAMTDDCFLTTTGRLATAITASYLSGVTADDIRQDLNRLIDTHQCNRLSSEDADYAAHWYPRLQSFYTQAARKFSAVIFTGDL